MFEAKTSGNIHDGYYHHLTKPWVSFDYYIIHGMVFSALVFDSPLIEVFASDGKLQPTTTKDLAIFILITEAENILER